MALPFVVAYGIGKKIWDQLPEETQVALRSSVTDIGISAVGGKRSVEEWAETFSASIDKYIEQAIEEDNLTYVGGHLKFEMEEKNDKFKLEFRKVLITYELFFQDSAKKWVKQTTEKPAGLSRLYFTPESLEAIEQGVKFEINYP